MKILKIAGVVIAVLVLAVLGMASRQPDEFRVERKIVVAAKPDAVFPWLNEPKKTTEWSPWEEKDPNMKKVFSGPAGGKGAVYEWDGNREIGAGKLEITESVPGKSVVMDLSFTRPMQDTSVARYDVAPVEGGSEVAWSISGKHTFVSKIMCSFMSMDKMIGGEFEKGLAKLKTVVEKKG